MAMAMASYFDIASMLSFIVYNINALNCVIVSIILYISYVLLTVRREQYEETLSGFENMYVQMQSPSRPNFIVGILVFKEKLPYDTFEKLFDGVSKSHTRLRSRLRKNSWIPFRHTLMRDSSFQLSNHLRRSNVESPGDEKALKNFISSFIEEPLDPNKPPWMATFIEGLERDRCAVAFKIHHCLGDGMSANMMLMSFAHLSDGRTIMESFKDIKLPKKRAMKIGSMAVLYKTIKEIVWCFYDMWRVTILSKSILLKRASTQKEVAWTSHLKLCDVKALKNALGITVNDILVASMTGAIRRIVQRRGETVPKEVFNIMPVSLRHPLDSGSALQNKVAGVWMFLPTGIENNYDRVMAVHQALESRKHNPTYIGFTLANMHLWGSFPSWFVDNMIGWYTDKAVSIFTNVPGPPSEIFVEGVGVEDIFIFGLQPGKWCGGLALSIMTYDGRVSFTMLDDVDLPNCKVKGSELMECFEEEFKSLEAEFLLSDKKNTAM